MLCQKNNPKNDAKTVISRSVHLPQDPITVAGDQTGLSDEWVGEKRPGSRQKINSTYRETFCLYYTLYWAQAIPTKSVTRKQSTSMFSAVLMFRYTLVIYKCICMHASHRIQVLMAHAMLIVALIL